MDGRFTGGKDGRRASPPPRSPPLAPAPASDADLERLDFKIIRDDAGEECTGRYVVLVDAPTDVMDEAMLRIKVQRANMELTHKRKKAGVGRAGQPMADGGPCMRPGPRCRPLHRE